MAEAMAPAALDAAPPRSRYKSTEGHRDRKSTTEKLVTMLEKKPRKVPTFDDKDAQTRQEIAWRDASLVS